jgi:RNA polymerase sigma factor (TIGR02999 family)
LKKRGSSLCRTPLPALPPPRPSSERDVSPPDSNQAGINQLVEDVYAELHRLAHAHMRREQGLHTLQTTALVHETYLRLAKCKHLNLSDRRLFFGLASRIMRHILVDYARSARAAKRGAGCRLVSLQEIPAVAGLPSADILALHEALLRLEAHDPRLGQVLELHAFGGLTNLEIAEALGLSLRTVNRELALARAWLRRFLSGQRAGFRR